MAYKVRCDVDPRAFDAAKTARREANLRKSAKHRQENKAFLLGIMEAFREVYADINPKFLTSVNLVFNSWKELGFSRDKTLAVNEIKKLAYLHGVQEQFEEKFQIFEQKAMLKAVKNAILLEQKRMQLR